MSEFVGVIVVTSFFAGWFVAALCFSWDSRSGDTIQDPEPWKDRRRPKK